MIYPTLTLPLKGGHYILVLAEISVSWKFLHSTSDVDFRSYTTQAPSPLGEGGMRFFQKYPVLGIF